MLFIGGISSNVKKVINKELEKLDKNRMCQVLFSGSFNMEQLLIKKGFKYISSCDISLLTSVIGLCAVNKILKINITNKDFFLLKKFENKSCLHNCAIVLTIYGATEFHKKNNYFTNRRYVRYLENLESVFFKNFEFIEKFVNNLKINDYLFKDAIKVSNELKDKNMYVFSYAPTYEGGYEKIYDFLNRSVEYDIPNYTIINEDIYNSFNKELLLNNESLVYSDREIDGFKDYLIAKVDNGSLKEVFIYSSILGTRKIIYKNVKKIEHTKYKYIKDDYEFNINSKIWIREIDIKEFEYLRDVFISKEKVKIFGKPQVKLAVMVDEYIIGVLGYNFNSDSGDLYLLTDFVVNNNIYRVSKLVIMLAKSKEINDFLKVKVKRIPKRLLTIVFTKKPVSMKYRGEWNKIIKKDDRIVYEAKNYGKLSIKGEYEEWIKKHYSKKKK